MHLNKEDPFAQPLPPIAVNTPLNFGWDSPQHSDGGRKRDILRGKKRGPNDFI